MPHFYLGSMVKGRKYLLSRRTRKLILEKLLAEQVLCLNKSCILILSSVGPFAYFQLWIAKPCWKNGAVFIHALLRFLVISVCQTAWKTRSTRQKTDFLWWAEMAGGKWIITSVVPSDLQNSWLFFLLFPVSSQSFAVFISSGGLYFHVSSQSWLLETETKHKAASQEGRSDAVINWCTPCWALR